MSKKAPFSKYSELAREGATIAWGDPSKPSTYPRGTFDVVYDNNGKDMESCQPMIDHFKVGRRTKETDKAGGSQLAFSSGSTSLRQPRIVAGFLRLLLSLGIERLASRSSNCH